MAELLSFPRGWKNVPAHAKIEVQAGQELQVYDVRLRFTARFGGLRWMMYNHRILSFVIGVTAFWSAECGFTIFTWLLLRLMFSSNEEDSMKVEETDGSVTERIRDGSAVATDDEPDLSDTPRTFPTYGRQAPLKFEPKVKEEESENLVLQETDILPLTNEADDEDDEALGWRGDSGLGTSYSEGGGRSSVTRRRSKGKSGGS